MKAVSYEHKGRMDIVSILPSGLQSITRKKETEYIGYRQETAHRAVQRHNEEIRQGYRG
jgi:hypothetical protein